jgi:ubiquinone/menaquinone biosynthesis C-methylase UbiE
MSIGRAATDQEIKACCAGAYASDWARFLIGDSMHPGGVQLTERLGDQLQLGPGSRVLDVGAGRGTSALALALRFGCQVVGVDLSPDNIAAAREQAARSGLAQLVSFEVTDAEALPFAAGEYDAVICECAFCTFPDKPRAASEMARVVRLGGSLGISDLVRRGELPAELQTLSAWVACIADARPEAEYVQVLSDSGFRQFLIETHDDALIRLVDEVRGRLLGASLFANLGKFDLADTDLHQAGAIARVAEAAARTGLLGYVLLTAVRTRESS